mgnify:CR=1 FL=1
MYNSFWDSLPVKVRHLILEYMILQKERSTWSQTHRSQLIADRMACCSGELVRHLKHKHSLLIRISYTVQTKLCKIFVIN